MKSNSYKFDDLSGALLIKVTGVDFKDADIRVKVYFNGSTQPNIEFLAEQRVLETNQVNTDRLDVPITPNSKSAIVVVESYEGLTDVKSIKVNLFPRKPMRPDLSSSVPFKNTSA